MVAPPHPNMFYAILAILYHFVVEEVYPSVITTIVIIVAIKIVVATTLSTKTKAQQSISN
jgi:uncharacterized membrane protein